MSVSAGAQTSILCMCRQAEVLAADSTAALYIVAVSGDCTGPQMLPSKGLPSGNPQDTALGTAIYLHASLLNHSCRCLFQPPRRRPLLQPAWSCLQKAAHTVWHRSSHPARAFSQRHQTGCIGALCNRMQAELRGVL